MLLLKSACSLMLSCQMLTLTIRQRCEAFLAVSGRTPRSSSSAYLLHGKPSIYLQCCLYFLLEENLI